MKIAISASGKESTNLLDSRFGRCPYFQIYDTDLKEERIVENKGQISIGGAGIEAAQQIIDENIDVVITGSLGPHAYQLFNRSGIKVYKSNSISVSSAIEAYNDGKLEELTEPGQAHGGMSMGLGHKGGR